MNKEQILSFTSAFPPVQKLTEKLIDFDYQKYYHQYMNWIVNVCAWVAAIATVIYDKWMQYDMTERVQLFALIVKEKIETLTVWIQSELIPELKLLWNDFQFVYNSVRKETNTISC